jgi:hypothetical protein
MRNLPPQKIMVCSLYCPPISGRGLYDRGDTLKEKEFPQFMTPTHRPPPKMAKE